MKKKGSYTVEAAFLMGIILSVLVGVVYIGFWYHDKNFLQSAAYEAACVASLRADEDNYQLRETAQMLTSGRMLGTTSLQTDCRNGSKKASVSFQGTFSLPGMIAAFFQKERLEIREACELTTERPSRRIQKIRGLLKIVQRAGGGGE